jgi:ribosomal protein S18 acetylase RimI-like enzyme
MQTQADDRVELPDAPDIPGLTFRRFRGESDYPKMVTVVEGSKVEDKIEDVDTVESIARGYSNLKNSDPYRDMLFAEVDGQVIGYNRVMWWEEVGKGRVYSHFGFLLPEWRHKGIGGAMLRHSERRLREIAAEHSFEGERILESYAADTQPGLDNLLKSEGYTPVRHFYDMVRPDLENIPDLPLPEGFEVRPVTPEHYRPVWEAMVEAFRDHWGEQEVEEEEFPRWMDEPHWQPHLWQIAWHGSDVAGMVQNYIDEDQNAKFNRKRGYTENIAVRRPYRKQGLASALIVRSLRMLKELGMEEAALGVDTENLSGALRLYEGLGFRAVKRSTDYRKPLAPEP